MQIVCPSFSLNIFHAFMIVAILIICLKKTLTKSRKVVHNFQKKTHKSVSNPSKAIVLNDTDFQNEESFLLDQSTSSTLIHKLNLYTYSNIENIRSKNSDRFIIAQLNIDSLRKKFDSLVEILHNNVAILLISETKINSSLPTPQFKIEGYTTHRLGRN